MFNTQVGFFWQLMDLPKRMYHERLLKDATEAETKYQNSSKSFPRSYL